MVVLPPVEGGPGGWHRPVPGLIQSAGPKHIHACAIPRSKKSHAMASDTFQYFSVLLLSLLLSLFCMVALYGCLVVLATVPTCS